MYSIVDATCPACDSTEPCECRECESCRVVTADPVELDGDSYCAECAVAIAEPHELPVWVRADYGVEEVGANA